MSPITIDVINDGQIDLCKDLCNELMAFQKSKATIAQNAFDSMNFDTRMKKNFENSERSHIAVAKDNGLSIGYVFSTIDTVSETSGNAFPDWAPRSETSKGFYPDWLALPQKIGCLNNLYIREPYQGIGLGKKLLTMSMNWLESFDDCTMTFVYISNGNDAAYQFYLKHGFLPSHDVFDGFIKAAYKPKEKNRFSDL